MTTILDQPSTPSPLRALADRFPRVVGPNDNGRIMTAAEFDAIEESDEEYNYELIEEVLIVNAAPGPMEADPNEELGHALRTYAEQNPGIIDKTLSEQYIRTKRSRRRADRVVWIGLGRVPSVKRDIPAIAVEFLSAGHRSWQRDYVHKLEEYLAEGVKEYWIFDRFRRNLAIFRSADNGVSTTVVAAGDKITSPLLPGFGLPVNLLLKCAEDWLSVEPDEEPS